MCGEELRYEGSRLGALCVCVQTTQASSATLGESMIRINLPQFINGDRYGDACMRLCLCTGVHSYTHTHILHAAARPLVQLGVEPMCVCTSVCMCVS